MLLNFQRKSPDLSVQAPSLIILHGLLGSLENWGAISTALANQFDVITADLRNHGRSGHSTTMNYQAMAEDVLELMDHLELSSAHLLGHSMGGKVAMQLAHQAPERIQRLILVDIAPVAYPAQHENVFAGLSAINLSQLQSRQEADLQLQAFVPEAGVRAFLLKNLAREGKEFFWRMNLEALKNHYTEIAAAPAGPWEFPQPTLFIKGECSDYLIPEYQAEILRRFSHASFKVIAGAGHWPHAEKPQVFLGLVERFLKAYQA
ncbi:alpha/beta fold hydrolase [Nitrincola tapanii]|uniref:Alpha/beta fold hydrolase n=1 Tax=Nitrincola tapanii TaxID=1708751 RepID=A0A5A9W2V0_9GAMM|nr:alpha/beta fold hydrolase [Nitrincola tapanii]KAA0873881.1 alpha/beta fold hydrolase [Nitrincola tapanii]